MRLSQELPLLAILATTAMAIPRNLFARDSSTGNCGTNNGGLSCSESSVNACCSSAGWCGDSIDHCGTGCQKDFGKCNDSTTPTSSTPSTPAPSSSSPPGTGGGSTVNVPRTKVGGVPYGVDIYDCNAPGTVALTFDDGPYIYTSKLLDILATAGAKATFFITGNNLDKGAIDNPANGWSTIIKRMDTDGHQIASHTWDHLDLSTLTEDARRSQMYQLETAMVNILGKFATYMRPPYSSCTGACPQTMSDLGYHIIYFDLDTDDYNQDTPALIINAQNNFKNAIVGTSPTTKDFLSIAHDIHQTTVDTLAGYMLQTLKDAGYRTVTVGECLGDPVANWYRTP